MLKGEVQMIGDACFGQKVNNKEITTLSSIIDNRKVFCPKLNKKEEDGFGVVPYQI